MDYTTGKDMPPLNWQSGTMSEPEHDLEMWKTGFPSRQQRYAFARTSCSNKKMRS
jgi:hypothetical protein